MPAELTTLSEVMPHSVPTTLGSDSLPLPAAVRPWQIKLRPAAKECRADNAPQAVGERISSEPIAAYTAGVRPEPRPVLPGYDSGIIGVMLGAMLIAILSIRHASSFIKSLGQNLLTVRRRSNVFDEHTVTETGAVMALVLLLCVCEGVLLYLAPQFGLNHESSIEPFRHVVMLSALALAYYLFQLMAYGTVGMVFGSKFQYTRWLEGFTASQTLLAPLLLIPTLAILFNPTYGAVAAIVAGSLYIIARIIFICKGFRIFYKNPYSLIYFILYLCALEIVPLCWIYKVSAILGATNL